jgi:hypothetical protein
MALVPSGTARRLIGAGAMLLISFDEYGTVISPMATGVGVAGGRIGLVARFLFGVDGDGSLTVSTGAVFLFLPAFAIGAEGGLYMTSLVLEEALNLADLRDDISRVRECLKCSNKRVQKGFDSLRL